MAKAGIPPENRTAYPLSAFPLHVVLDGAFAYLEALYPTHSDYVDKVTANVEHLAAPHWLTDYDAAQLISRAQAANIPGS